jgi:hypothetical protein
VTGRFRMVITVLDRSGRLVDLGLGTGHKRPGAPFSDRGRIIGKCTDRLLLDLDGIEDADGGEILWLEDDGLNSVVLRREALDGIRSFGSSPAALS